MKHLLLLIVIVLLAVGIPQLALAGMPSITLSDIAETHLESISFFLCIIFLSPTSSNACGISSIGFSQPAGTQF
jgi:hypothetical protein